MHGPPPLAAVPIFAWLWYKCEKVLEMVWGRPALGFGAPTHTNTHTRCSPVTLDFPCPGPAPSLCNGAVIYKQSGACLGTLEPACPGARPSRSFSSFFFQILMVPSNLRDEEVGQEGTGARSLNAENKENIGGG